MIMEQMWKKFEARVLASSDYSDKDRKHLRCAFYGGAITLFYTIMGHLSAGEEVKDTDIIMMMTIRREFDIFEETLDEMLKSDYKTH